ncbi:hypothetical protein ACFX1X_035919 [Malus domestica]
MDTNEDFKSVFLEMLHKEICVGHSLLCVGQSLQVQAATPKQIRELMKFDGLTNDEVKSHLQEMQHPMEPVKLNHIDNIDNIDKTDQAPLKIFKPKPGSVIPAKRRLVKVLAVVRLARICSASADHSVTPSSSTST